MKKTILSSIISLIVLATPFVLSYNEDNSTCLKNDSYNFEWKQGTEWPDSGTKEMLVCQVIPDTNLRNELSRTTTELIDTTKVNQADLNRIVGEKLILTNASITNLEGIQYLTSLKSLVVSNSNIIDIDQLNKLIELQTLKITNSNIKSIRSLSVLNKLEHLDLENNNINNLDAISSLTNLKTLNLNRNKVTSLSALSSMKDLESLYLESNNIKTINYLKDLNNLKVLSLANNLISDLSPIQDNQRFTNLYLSNNMISDFSRLNLDNEAGFEGRNQVISLALRSSNNEISFNNPLQGLKSEIIDLKYGSSSICNADGFCKITKLKRENNLDIGYQNRMADSKLDSNITGQIQIEYGSNLVEVTDLLLESEMSVSVNGTTKVATTFITRPVLDIPFNTELDYYSDDYSIASVDNNGVVMGNKLGETYINVVSKQRVYSENSSTLDFIRKKVKVKVEAINHVEKLSVPEKELVLIEGDTYQINPKIEPKNATFKQVKYSKDEYSDDIITLSQTGEIYALSVGEATVIVGSVENEKVQREIKVKVIPIQLKLPAKMNMMDVALVKTIGHVEQFKTDKDILVIEKVKDNEYRFKATESGKVKVTYFVGMTEKTYEIQILPIAQVKKVKLATNDKNKTMTGYFELQGDTWFNSKVVTKYYDDQGNNVLVETREFSYDESKCQKTNKYLLMNCSKKKNIKLVKDNIKIKTINFLYEKNKEVKVEEIFYENDYIVYKDVYDVKGLNGLYEYNYNSKTRYNYVDGKYVKER